MLMPVDFASLARTVCVLSALSVPWIGTPVDAGSVDPRTFAPDYVHEVFGPEDGLPKAGFSQVTGTIDGFLWIATFDGLVRYDGARFERFGVASAPALGSNRIPHAQAALDGALWIINETGSVSLHTDGRFVGCPAPNESDAVRCDLAGPGPQVYHTIHRDQRGGVWVSGPHGPLRAVGDRLIPVPGVTGTAVVGAVQIDPWDRLWFSSEMGLWLVENGVGRSFTRELAWPSDYWTLVRHAVVAGDGTQWLVRDFELGRIETIPGTARRRFEPVRRLDQSTGLFADRLGTLWVISGWDLLHYRDGQWTEVARTSGAWPEIPMAHRVAVDPRRGESWVVWARGLVREQGFEALPLVAEPDRINSLWIEPSGTIWATSFRGTLHALYPTRVENRVEGIGHPILYSVLEEPGGTVWTTGRTLFRSAGFASGEPFEDLGCPSGATNCGVNVVERDGAGRLWVGVNTGLFRSDGDGWLRREPVAGLDSHVWSLRSTRDGALWAGTRQGLFRLAPAADEDSWEPVQLARDGDDEPWVRTLHEGDAGALWLGTSGAGLLRWHDGELTDRLDPASGFPSDMVRSIWQAPDGRLWIGTETAGLVRVTPKSAATGRASAVIDRVELGFHRPGSENDVPIRGVHFVVADHHGDLWLSTNEGIFRGRFDHFQAAADGRSSRVPLTRYAERDGLFDREANGGNQHAGLLDRTGQVVFPTQGGLVRIDPEASPPDEPLPTASIDRLLVGRNTRSVTEPVALTPDERNFSIRITAPHLRDAASLRFRARLVPYETDWVDLGARRTAFYTQVPPGHYRFEATVAHDGVPHRGQWNPQLATLEIDIEPRWVETPAFTALLVLALIGAIAGGVRWRLGLLRRRAESLERTVAERTATIARQAEALRELDQIKSDFFANVSHEFRTPLTLILGSLRDARDPKHAAARERLDQVALDNAGRLLGLVDQLLDVAKLDSGGLRLDARRGDLGMLVRAAIERATPLAERVQVELRASPLEEPVEMIFDPVQLEKVLDNLIGNALKFVPRGRSVEVILRRSDGEVELTVRDDGPGIAPEHLERIFDRFYQVRDERRVDTVGSGLGLALSRQIVELHGGTLIAESVEGAGAAFVVRLPIEGTAARDGVADPQGATARAGWLAEPQASVVETVEEAEREPTTGAEPQLGPPDERPTVLLVDDHPELRAYLRRHLEATYRVVEAADGRQALAEATSRTPDVVVTDIMMPELDGRALFRHLREDPELELVPVILVTAVASSESRLEGLREGVDDYLVKPFDPRELVARIDNLLASRRRLLDRAVPPLAAEVVDEPPMPSADQRFVDKVRGVIAERLDDSELTVEALAFAVGCDRSHLLRRLRTLTGQTPSALIRTMRLERAEQLLRANAGRVNEIAYSVGFKSLAHFSNTFAKTYGERPSTFAARHAAPVR